MDKILIVDDAAFMRMMIKDSLKKGGYSNFIEAENGEIALGEYKENHPDLVLLDITMPVMDGMSALQIIHSRWPKTQVILLSGHADMQLAVQAMSDGAFGYLMKPVDLDELLFKIEDAATQCRLEAEQGSGNNPS